MVRRARRDAARGAAREGSRRLLTTGRKPPPRRRERSQRIDPRSRRAGAGCSLSFTRREISTATRAASAGLAWTLLHPLAQLAIYAFVFSQVFRAGVPAGYPGVSYIDVRRRGALALDHVLRGRAARHGRGRARTRASSARWRFPHRLLVFAAVLACCAVHPAGFLAVLARAARSLGEPIRSAALPVAFAAARAVHAARRGHRRSRWPRCRRSCSDVEHVAPGRAHDRLLRHAHPLSARASCRQSLRPWLALNPARLFLGAPARGAAARRRPASRDASRIASPARRSSPRASGSSSASRRTSRISCDRRAAESRVGAHRRRCPAGGVAKDYPKVATGGGPPAHARSRSLFAPRATCRISARWTASTWRCGAGESLGLIGENGAGKSTLLKIIAGVVRPTRGDGRGAAAGWARCSSWAAASIPTTPAARTSTSRRALMGLSHREARAKVDAIIEFADIGEHIDEPIKHYSSGMVVRLGFAVATALEPELLITDEVLAVGDESFQKKCIAWLEGYLATAARCCCAPTACSTCRRSAAARVWIHHGRARACRATSFDVTREYLTYHEEKRRAARPRPRAAGRGHVPRIMSAWTERADGTRTDTFRQGETLVLQGVAYEPDDRAARAALRHRARRRHVRVRIAIPTRRAFAPAPRARASSRSPCDSRLWRCCPESTRMRGARPRSRGPAALRHAGGGIRGDRRDARLRPRGARRTHGSRAAAPMSADPLQLDEARRHHQSGDYPRAISAYDEVPRRRTRSAATCGTCSALGRAPVGAARRRRGERRARDRGWAATGPPPAARRRRRCTTAAISTGAERRFARAAERARTGPRPLAARASVHMDQGRAGRRARRISRRRWALRFVQRARLEQPWPCAALHRPPRRGAARLQPHALDRPAAIRWPISTSRASTTCATTPARALEHAQHTVQARPGLHSRRSCCWATSTGASARRRSALAAYSAAARAAPANVKRAAAPCGVHRRTRARFDEARDEYRRISAQFPGEPQGRARRQPAAAAGVRRRASMWSACAREYGAGPGAGCTPSAARFRFPRRASRRSPQARWTNFYLAYQGRDDRELQSRYGDFLRAVLERAMPEHIAPRAAAPAADDACASASAATSSSTARRAATSRRGSRAWTAAASRSSSTTPTSGSPTTRAPSRPPPTRSATCRAGPSTAARARRSHGDELDVARLSRARHAPRHVPAGGAAARARAVRGMGTSHDDRAADRSTTSLSCEAMEPARRRSATTASAWRCCPAWARTTRRRARTPGSGTREDFGLPADATALPRAAIALQDPSGQRRAARAGARAPIRAASRDLRVAPRRPSTDDVRGSPGCGARERTACDIHERVIFLAVHGARRIPARERALRRDAGYPALVGRQYLPRCARQRLAGRDAARARFMRGRQSAGDAAPPGHRGARRRGPGCVRRDRGRLGRDGRAAPSRERISAHGQPLRRDEPIAALEPIRARA